MQAIGTGVQAMPGVEQAAGAPPPAVVHTVHPSVQLWQALVRPNAWIEVPVAGMTAVGPGSNARPGGPKTRKQ